MKRCHLLILILLMLVIGVAGWNKVTIEMSKFPCLSDSECAEYYLEKGEEK